MRLGLRRTIRMLFLCPGISGECDAAYRHKDSQSELKSRTHFSVSTCFASTVRFLLRPPQPFASLSLLRRPLHHLIYKTLRHISCCVSGASSDCTGGGNSFNGSKFESTS